MDEAGKGISMCKGTGALNSVCAAITVVVHRSSIVCMGGQEGGCWGERGARRGDGEVGRARK